MYTVGYPDGGERITTPGEKRSSPKITSSPPRTVVEDDDSVAASDGHAIEAYGTEVATWADDGDGPGPAFQA